MRKFLSSLILLVVLFAGEKNLVAQQIVDFSMFRENQFLFNPAMAGVERVSIVQASFRKQFTGISGAPLSAIASYHTYLKEKNIGLGGYLFTDQTGPTGYTGLNFSFAYHIVFSDYRRGVSERKALSFGLSSSIVQHRINGSKIKLDQPMDDAIFRNRGSQFFPDFSFGVHYRSKTIFASVAIPQLLHLDVPMRGQDGEKSRLKKMQHYFAMFSGKIYVGDNRNKQNPTYIEPGVNMHYVIGAPPQIVSTVRFAMEDLFFIGMGYRSMATAVFEGGFTINKQINIFYSYDYGAGRLVRQDIGQTHEIGVSYKFGKDFWLY
jgi:type IX secretion system PorP/SprF family membrane protein